jgi:UDP-glucose 4-epimerase
VAYCQGDFANTALLATLLDDHEEVVHLAYASVPNTVISDPLADLVQNLTPAIGLFAASARRGRKLLLVSSGGTVYGEALAIPITELHPTQPVSPYGLTKLTIENFARMCSAVHGLALICVRPANAYGVGQRPFSGQGFISTAMAAAMRGDPVKLFGREGTVRDYLYIDDLARGVARALDFGQPGETYNLGSGVGLSNRQVLEAITPVLHRMGMNLDIEELPARPTDVKVNVLDSNKLRDHTGWQPRVDLTEGLERTARWLKAEYA